MLHKIILGLKFELECVEAPEADEYVSVVETVAVDEIVEIPSYAPKTDFTSPYLERPIRSLDEALKDRERRKNLLIQASISAEIKRAA